MKITKPPLGLKPRWAHDAERLWEVQAAIARHYNAGAEIPVEWIEEYNELVKIVSRNTKKGDNE